MNMNHHESINLCDTCVSGAKDVELLDVFKPTTRLLQIESSGKL